MIWRGPITSSLVGGSEGRRPQVRGRGPPTRQCWGEDSLPRTAPGSRVLSGLAERDGPNRDYRAWVGVPAVPNGHHSDVGKSTGGDRWRQAGASW